MLDGVVTVAGISQSQFHGPMHFFRRIIPMQLKNTDKIPSSLIVSLAPPQN
jgi:hypothetical protein